MLGVDPDTLRRWADSGKVDVFQTPGRHRRFLRSAIEGMLPQPRQPRRQSLSAIGETPDRISAEFRRRVRTDLASHEWATSLDEDTIRWFREHGVRLSDLLLGSLDAGRRDGRDRLLTQAAELGRQHGEEAARRGLSLGESTQMFLFFRARFMAEIATVARRRSLEPTAATLLFEEADNALDRVIVALIAGHQAKRANGAAGARETV